MPYSRETGLYHLEEPQVCDALDADQLMELEADLRGWGSVESPRTAMFSVDKNDAVACEYIPGPDGLFLRIAESIRSHRGGPHGECIEIHASIVPFVIEPLWHGEGFSGAYVTTTYAATQGLSGAVPAESQRQANGLVIQMAKDDPDFIQTPGIEVVNSPLHSLLSLDHGTIHRSHPQTEGMPETKLLINASARQQFAVFF